MFVDPSKNRRWYWRAWQLARFRIAELTELVRELEFKVKARDHSIRQLQSERGALEREAARLRRRLEDMEERRAAPDPVTPYRAVIEKSLTLLHKIRPGCTCVMWKKERRHAENCAIIQRLRVDAAAEDLGITHWRDDG